MKINKHICFDVNNGRDLYGYLVDNNISFKNVHGLIVLDIFTDNPHWTAIADLLNQVNIPCQSNTVFSKKDFKGAEWISIRSTWHQGYPQPASDFGYQSITYSKENFCCSCGSGLVQKSAFRLKKEPNWGTKHFATLYWVEELFVDSIARRLLEVGSFSGVHFREVLNYSGQSSFHNTSQLFVDSIIEPGIVEDTDFIRNKKICPACGIAKYTITGIGMPTFSKESFCNACDIVKSSELFGDGKRANRMIIVKRSVYEFLTGKGLTRGLEFTPVKLI